MMPHDLGKLRQGAAVMPKPACIAAVPLCDGDKSHSLFQCFALLTWKTYKNGTNLRTTVFPVTPIQEPSHEAVVHFE